jgi:hypothetical protein
VKFNDLITNVYYSLVDVKYINEVMDINLREDLDDDL